MLAWGKGAAFLPLAFGTANHWMERARESRAIAAQIVDPLARQAMLEVAEKYVAIAKRAEAREAGVDIPSSDPK